jgi:chaperone modulatory protein CbpM
MITIEALFVQVRGLRRDDLERWITQSWVRPDGEPGRYLFHDIDVARVQLILELREQMQVNEEALPVVLSLLDQLYEARRRMRRVRDALDQATTEDLRQALMQLMMSDPA